MTKKNRSPQEDEVTRVYQTQRTNNYSTATIISLGVVILLLVAAIIIMWNSLSEMQRALTSCVDKTMTCKDEQLETAKKYAGHEKNNQDQISQIEDLKQQVEDTYRQKTECRNELAKLKDVFESIRTDVSAKILDRAVQRTQEVHPPAEASEKPAPKPTPTPPPTEPAKTEPTQ